MVKKMYTDGFARGVDHERRGIPVLAVGPKDFCRGYMDGRMRERGKKECPARAGDPQEFSCSRDDVFCPYAAMPIMAERFERPDCQLADWENLDIGRHEDRLWYRKEQRRIRRSS